MKPSRISLSVKGLIPVAALATEHNFRFIVGEHTYPCHTLFADFLSPTVAKIHTTDALASEFTLNINDSNHEFRQFITLMHGNSLKVDESNADYIFEVASLLGNQDLQSKVLQYQSSPLSPSNVIDRILQKQSCRVSCTRELTFAAQHFSKVKKAELAKLDVDTLKRILMDKKLVIKTEKSLFKFVAELIGTRGPEYRALLSCVLFENLGVKQMKQFVELITPSDIDTPMWENLCHRICAPTLADENNCSKKRYKRETPAKHTRTDSDHEKRLLYNGVPFNGIIDYLTRQSGGNVDRTGAVAITASTSGHNQPWQVADFGWPEKWMSFNEPDSWIQFDFKKRRVACTKYTIKTANWGPDANHIKSWVLEGSKTGKDWKKLDTQKDNSDLNGRSLTKTFSTSVSEPFRYLRIRMTGTNHIGNDYLCLTNVEFFGVLMEH